MMWGPNSRHEGVRSARQRDVNGTCNVPVRAATGAVCRLAGVLVGNNLSDYASLIHQAGALR